MSNLKYRRKQQFHDFRYIMPIILKTVEPKMFEKYDFDRELTGLSNCGIVYQNTLKNTYKYWSDKKLRFDTF